MSHVCRDLRDRYVCASAAKRIALSCGFTSVEASQIAVCAAELASNAVRHAGGGVLHLRILKDAITGVTIGLELRCEDEGPGLGDVDSALKDGYSCGRFLQPDDTRREGLGMGLGTVRRLMDDLVVEPKIRGTVVTARRFASAPKRHAAGAR
jgi:serine/threonine-protein kinase RsbT